MIPKDAYDLYGINEELLRKRYQVFKEAWKRIKSGADESEVYEWVEEELGSNDNEVPEEAEETEEPGGDEGNDDDMIL